MNKKSELVKNTLILGLGTILSKTMSFILLPLYTIYLTPSEYGTFDLIVSYVWYLAPLLTIQLEWSAFRFLIDARNDEEEKKRVISNITIIITILSLAYVLLSYCISLFIKIPHFEPVLLLGVSMIFMNVTLQFARGLGVNKKFAIANVLTGASMLLAVSVFVIIAGWGMRGAIISTVLANVITTVYLVASLKLHRYVRPSYFEKIYQKKLIRYSSPLVPEGVSWWVVNASDRTIISLVIGTAANGIYAAANRYAMIFGAIFSVFNMSWNESASMHINDNDRDHFFSETSNAMIKFFGSLGIVMIAFLPPVFNFLINQQFAEAYVYVPILVLGAFFHAISGLYSSIYVAKKLTKQIARTTIVAALVNLIINLALISSIGIYAAAVSTATAYLFLAIYRHYDVKKYVSITYDTHVFLPLALLYSIFITLYYINNPITNIASAIAATAVAILFNRSIVSVIKNKLIVRRRTLNTDELAVKEFEEQII